MPALHRRLRLLLAVAIGVSIVHYIDNTINYDAYPQPTRGPAPSVEVVAISWFVFTAFAVAAYVALRRGRRQLGAALLAVYSGSGLVGLAHYTVPGATDMVWWRQAHIVADIVCGVLVLVAAVQIATRREDQAVAVEA